jgi:hypothetical protein
LSQAGQDVYILASSGAYEEASRKAQDALQSSLAYAGDAPTTQGYLAAVSDISNRAGWLCALVGDASAASQAFATALESDEKNRWLYAYNAGFVAALGGEFAAASSDAARAEDFLHEARTRRYEEFLMLVFFPTPAGWGAPSVGWNAVPVDGITVRPLVALQKLVYQALAGDLEASEFSRTIERSVSEEQDGAVRRLAGWAQLTLCRRPDLAVGHFEAARLERNAPTCCDDELAFAKANLIQTSGTA